MKRQSLLLASVVAACGGGSTTTTADAPPVSQADAAPVTIDAAIADAPVAVADAPLQLPDAPLPDAPPAPDATLPADAAPPDAQGPSTGASLVNADVTLDVWSVAGVVGSAGAVELRVGKRASPDYTLVNVVADLDGDGAVAPYPAGGGMQEEWLIRNEPLPAIDRRIALGFDLLDTSLADRPAVRVRVTTGSAALSAAPSLAWTSNDGSRAVDAAITLRVLESFTPPPDGFAGARPQEVTDYNMEWLTETPGTSDNGTNHFYQNHLGEAPPGINNCVPGTVAANLANLAERDGWSDGLRPGAGDPPFGTGTNEGLQDLQDYLITSSDEWSWTPEKGVALGKIVAGKNEMAEKMGLPVHTTFIAAGPEVNIPVAIEENLRDGCAVELVMGISRPGGGTFGHMVGVAGFVQGGAPPVQFILHDGLTPNLNEGYRMQDDGSIPGYRQAGKRVGAVGIGLVVECTEKVAALKLDYPHGDLPAGALVHLRCVTGGFVAEAFPVNCECTHQHGEISITGGGGPYADTKPDNCGHGCIVEALPKDLAVKCFGPM